MRAYPADVQLLETGLLHADPHPGNLLRTADGKICILDFGLMTEVAPERRIALVEYIAHLSVQDWNGVAKDLVNLGFTPEGMPLVPHSWGGQAVFHRSNPRRCAPCKLIGLQISPAMCLSAGWCEADMAGGPDPWQGRSGGVAGRGADSAWLESTALPHHLPTHRTPPTRLTLKVIWQVGRTQARPAWWSRWARC